MTAHLNYQEKIRRETGLKIFRMKTEITLMNAWVAVSNL